MKKPRQGQPEELARLAPMELFVLALLASGRVASVYDFKRRLLLSQGAMQPTLKRLETLGYVGKQSPTGALRRKELTLTPSGREILLQKWTWGLSEAAVADADTVLRVVWAAAQLDEAVAQSFLAAALDEKKQQTKQLMDEAKRFRPSQDDPDSLYRWMRLQSQAEQIAAEYRSLSVAERALRDWIQQKKQPDEQDPKHQHQSHQPVKEK